MYLTSQLTRPRKRADVREGSSAPKPCFHNITGTDGSPPRLSDAMR